MAKPEQVKQIREVAKGLGAIDVDTLIVNTAEWGRVDFQTAKSDIQLIVALSNHLAELPIEILPNATADQFLAQLRQSATALEAVRNFKVLGTANPTGERDGIVNTIASAAEQLLVGTQGWIGFLAYQKGDVQRNLKALSDAVTTANDMLVASKGTTAKAAGEIDGIISAAREASATVGVAHFTADFSGEASTNETEAKLWLKWTAGLAVATIVAAVASFFVPIPEGAARVAQYMTSKLVLLGVLITATLWCGRIYRATRHQHATNKHRANALKSFQAFVKATDDEPTRNAVLLETTRSIFSIAPSGYLDSVDSSGGDKRSSVLEMVKPSSGS